MFSFIKWFEAKWQEMKRNKGLWFSFLTVFSLLGIFVSLYFVNFLVSDVAKKTYENQKKHYYLESKALLDSYTKNVLAVATAVGLDTGIQMLFQSDDENKTDKITAIAAAYTQKFAQNLGDEDLFVHFTYRDKIVDTKLVNGLKVNPQGVTITAAMPLSQKENIRFGLEVDQDIVALKRHYAKEHKEFALLLDRGAFSLIDPQIRKERYHTLFDTYYADLKTFDAEFVKDVGKAELKPLLKNGYSKDMHYFYTVKKAYGYDGQEIGLLVIGEKISEKNSFVNLIKNLVNSVTIVALGLIVSMILFLF